jgi:hypothetical protein
MGHFQTESEACIVDPVLLHELTFACVLNNALGSRGLVFRVIPGCPSATQRTGPQRALIRRPAR